MIYHFIGFVIKFTVQQFFRKIHITGAPQVTEGPVLFTPNHPNQAVDPFIIGTVLNREVSFLAKSTLFDNPILGYLFRKLRMIPVYRRSDKSDPTKNDETFRAVTDALCQGRAIVIFPEGTSTESRQILPLKTGAARMAFAAESKMDFTLGCKIQPVSLTYSDPYTFQSSVTVTFGDPILVGGYKNAWKENEQLTVKELTQSLDRQLRSLAVDLKDIANQPLVEKIARLFSAFGPDDRERFQQIAAQVESLAPRHAERRKDLERRIDYYLDMATVFNLEHYHPYLDRAPSTLHRAKFLLLSPLIVLGIATHAAPYYSIRTLIELFRIEKYNYASAKILFSIVLFPIWHFALLLLLANYVGNIFLAIAAVAAIIFSGFVTSLFFDRFWLATIEFLWPGDVDPVSVLTKIRDELRVELRSISTD